MVFKLNTFTAYVFNYWLRKVNPNKVSVHGNKILRTNNPSEVVIKSLNSILGTKKKPSPMYFTRKFTVLNFFTDHKAPNTLIMSVRYSITLRNTCYYL